MVEKFRKSCGSFSLLSRQHGLPRRLQRTRRFISAVNECYRDVAPTDPVRMKISDGSGSHVHTSSRRALVRDYVAMANLFAFSSHLGAFKPITRSHKNTDPSTRKAE